MQLAWPITAEPDTLTPDVVHVWAVLLDATLADEWVLSSEEQRRAGLFRRPDARRRFVAARVGLRTILGRYLGTSAAGVPLGFEPAGKPRLAPTADGEPSLQFNLSHSGELALVAVAEKCDVGVDVERLRPVRRLAEIATRFFSRQERDAILAADPAVQVEAFLRCWTGKEAVLKAIGLGLGHPLDAFDAWPVDPRGQWIELPPRSSDGVVRCWLVPLTPEGEYVGAVACVGGCRRAMGYTLGR